MCLEDENFLFQAEDFPSENPHALQSTTVNLQDPDTGIASIHNILLAADLATATYGGQGITECVQASGPARDRMPSSPPHALYML